MRNFCLGSCNAKIIRFAANERRMESAERANTRLSAFASGRQWRLFGYGYQTSQTVEQLQTSSLLLMWSPDAARRVQQAHSYRHFFLHYGFFFFLLLLLFFAKFASITYLCSQSRTLPCILSLHNFVSSKQLEHDASRIDSVHAHLYPLM